MTDYERLRQLRKKLGLSQTAFAEKLGLTRGVIKNIELGLVEIKDHVLKLIVSTFNASEEWIKTGQGEMFVKSNASLLQELSIAYNLNSRELMIIQAFLELNSDGRKGVLEYVEKLVALSNSSKELSRDEIISKRIAEKDKEFLENAKTTISLDSDM